MSLPEYCGAVPGDEDYRYAEQYWQGVRYSWDDLIKIITGKLGVMRVSRGIRSRNFSPKHIGLSPYANGLVVLDCDVRSFYTTTGRSNTSMGPVFGTVGVRRTRGIDDLAALCSSLGHDLSELATYTVRTPSGGLHLYFHQNIETPIGATSHHREGWLIDVIASEHNWVAAPPTPGYEVVCDYPVATMPDWLAEALTGINQSHAPVGGRRRSAADEQVRRLRQQITLQQRDLRLDENNLVGRWLAAQVDLIRIANDNGCWNLTIYQVTKDLARFGWDYDSVETIVLAAAQPWSDSEERNAIATIRSGFKNLARNFGR
jgi:hypothetical protein